MAFIHRATRFALVAGIATVVVAAGQPAGAATGGAVTGVVQDVVVDDPAHGPASGPAGEETQRILRVGDDVIPLAGGSLPAADSGDTVRARLKPAGNGEQRVTSATTIAQAPAAAGATAGGAGTTVHDVYAVIATPNGVPVDARLTAAVVANAVGSASSYWSDQTGGAVSFRLANATSVPAYTSAYACRSGTAERDMWTEALTKVDVPANGTNHLMVFAPARSNDAGCAYGLGSIGAWPGLPGLTFVAGTSQSLVAHELGHNLGLHHSGALRCGSLQDGAYRSAGSFSGCELEPYGDLFDVMGYSGAGYGEGNLNAVHLHKMGLLPVHQITTAGTHTVRIAPLSAATTGTRVLRVVEPSGGAYFVEYRTDSGRDRAAAGLWQGPTFGVRVLRAVSLEGGSAVLDATPAGDTGYAHTLPVGGTFTSAARRLTITVTGADSTGATLAIRNGAVSAPGRATLSGLPRAANHWGPVTARVTVRDAAGRPVPGWTVHLQKWARGNKWYYTIKTLRTDANGVASLRFNNGYSGYYRYVTAAGSGVPARVSNAMFVVSRGVVSMRRPASTVRRGTVRLTGTVSAVSGPKVYLQVRRGNGRWYTPARASVRGRTVAGTVRLSRGTYQVRFYLKTGSSGIYSYDYSPAYRIRVR